MIDENHNQKFELSGNDDEPEDILHDELQELKIEKLGQRVTLLTILIPCMIGVILIIAYLDIKDRVARTHDTGAIGVQKLSKDLSSKFSSLSLEQAKIKDTQAQILPKLEKSTAFLQSKLSGLQKTVSQMSDSNVSREELSRVANALNDKIGDVPESLKSEFEALATVDIQLGKDLQRTSEERQIFVERLNELQNGIDSVRNELSVLSQNSIAKDELELALKLKEIGYRQSLLDTTGQLEKEIKKLRKEVENLKKRSPPSTKKATAAPVQKSQKPVAETKNSTQNQQAETTPPAKSDAGPSGGITEQTIQ